MVANIITIASLRVIYKIRGEDVFKHLNEYRTLEKAGTQAVAIYKRNCLRNICQYVISEIAYYESMRRYYDSELDLDSYPVLCKKQITHSMKDFILPNVRLSWRSTSGSTGIPFKFPKDREATAHMDAIMYHFYSWHGIEVGDKQARIWGAKLGLMGRLFEKIKDCILNRKRLSAFRMDDLSCSQYFNKLRKYKPKYFYSYANAMYQFALSLERQGLDGRLLDIPVAICTGEVLFPFQREKIEAVLGCKVVNEYGTTENGIIAFECEYKKLHIAPTIEVEILNPDTNGYGNVVVTELNSKVIPFLRYNTGDIARISDNICECGKPYHVLELKEGRQHDIIICPDGKIVYASLLSYVLKKYVIKFKAIQEKIDLIQINIVPIVEYSKAHENKIITDLTNCLGPDIHISITVFEDILPEKSGKLRYFESKVARQNEK